MVAAVETMAYAGETPWHGLGTKVNSDMTPDQILKAAGLDWKVGKVELFYKKNGTDFEPVPDNFGLVRNTDQSLLSVVGRTWKEVQNHEGFEFFSKFVKAGHMTMETAGSLWNGRYVWALARIGKDFKLGKDDKIDGYMMLSLPHVRGKAIVYQFTPIRVVCWNTFSWALGADLKGKPGAFRMSHASKWDESMKGQAELALGLAKGQMEEFHECAEFLTKKKATAPKVEEFFCEVLQYDPKEARKKKDETVVEPRMLPKFRHALEHAPGQQMPTAIGTWWGALNAVSYVIDHENGRERDTALKNAWMGHQANVKRKAVHLAIDMAKGARSSVAPKAKAA